MFSQLSFISALLALSSTYASPVEDIFGRSVGSSCKAPEGSGSCQNTSNCMGISYPTGLCPNDPNDVQVRRARQRLVLIHYPEQANPIPTVLREHQMQERQRLLPKRQQQRLQRRLLPRWLLPRKQRHPMLRQVLLAATTNRWNGGGESPREGNDCQGCPVYAELTSSSWPPH